MGLTLRWLAGSETLKEEGSSKYSRDSKDLSYSIGLIVMILKAIQNKGIDLEVFDRTFFKNCNITASNFFEKILFVPLDKRYRSNTPLKTFLANDEKDLNAITRLLLCDAFHKGLIKEDVWSLLSEIINNMKNTYVSSIFYALINILTSENFAEGLITTEHLELIQNLNLNLKTTYDQYYSPEEINEIDNKNWISANRCECIVDVLTSENFKKGVIKLEDLKLLETGYSLNTYPEQFAEYHNKLPMILKSENYAKGLIPHEWLVAYINLREFKYNFICGLDNIIDKIDPMILHPYQDTFNNREDSCLSIMEILKDYKSILKGTNTIFKNSKKDTNKLNSKENINKKDAKNNKKDKNEIPCPDNFDIIQIKGRKYIKVMLDKNKILVCDYFKNGRLNLHYIPLDTIYIPVGRINSTTFKSMWPKINFYSIGRTLVNTISTNSLDEFYSSYRKRRGLK